MKDLIYIYSGSFDPVTVGHADIIDRASALCGELVVAVLQNTSKTPMFALETRLDMLRAVCAEKKNVRVTSYGGLLKDLIPEVRANGIIRGVRGLGDFEYGMQSCSYFHAWHPACETIMIPSRPELLHISSTLAREHILLGDHARALVPDCVAAIIEKARSGRKGG
jgi:pantetheine-phosphate adenylyltransferase